MSLSSKGKNQSDNPSPASLRQSTTRRHGGKLIVFEGIDSSGKFTQTELLIKKLKEQGYRTESIHFPQYGNKSAGLAENYLSGKYGSAEEVNPYISSIFYACDRYDGSFQIRKWLEEGKIIVADRYVASNMAHQGGKILDKKERKEFFHWIWKLEYELFQIPHPDYNIVLTAPPDTCYALAKEPSEKSKHKKEDVHNKNITYFKKAFQAYQQIIEEFPSQFREVKCGNKNGIFNKEKIHRKILSQLPELFAKYFELRN